MIDLPRTLLPRLVDNSPAQVLNVSSLSSFFPLPNMAVYAATKSFILNVSLALRAELRSQGVNVSVLCPSGIATNADATSRIQGQGWVGRVSCSTTAEVARAAFVGMQRKRAIIIPGRINRVFRRLSSLLPVLLLIRLLARRFDRVAHHEPVAAPHARAQTAFPAMAGSK